MLPLQNIYMELLIVPALFPTMIPLTRIFSLLIHVVHFSWVEQYGCLISHTPIFKLYMLGLIDVQADWRRWTYGRAHMF